MAQVETLGIVPESKAVFELIMRYLTALEFADARRQASLGNAPSCAYFPAKP
ncbi:hypothetical protein HaLaN_05913 [Haematococcus lacustris]|uniref:Uncharacterized protein n=1 Tax=Haematococcus lacustris TaxID=44745 RepID=A0A699YK25_HAELA|nr:hypothetical protein HaLaN_05913 [Haematococcus lacustris]